MLKLLSKSIIGNKQKELIDRLLSHTGDVALRRRASWILIEILKQRPKRILDLGCGDGFYLHLISELLPRVELTGIDPDPAALKSAKNNLSVKKIKLIKGGFPNLPFSNRSFDIVLLSEVLEHVNNDLNSLKEVYRVLRSNGKIIISVPHSQYPFLWDPINWLLEKLFNYHIKTGFFAGIWNQHKRLYSTKELSCLLLKVGFRLMKSEILVRYCLPFNHYLLNVVARILVSYDTHKRSAINKFNINTGYNKSAFNPFFIVFKFDRLNDIREESNIGVSLVAIAKK